MRLTLRVLLGWIDGVLPPEKQELAGERVPGSELAMVLCERIRRARSPGPISGPAIADDPNLVAEYIDNTLPATQLAAFERLCIDSEPHLAEVASCHKMLADVFREPQRLMLPRDRRHGLRRLFRTAIDSAGASSPPAGSVRRDPRLEGEAEPPPRPMAASALPAPAEVSPDAEAAPAAAVPPSPASAAQHDYADARAAAGALVLAALHGPQRQALRRPPSQPPAVLRSDPADLDRVPPQAPAAWPADDRPDAGGFAASPNQPAFLDSPLAPGSPAEGPTVAAASWRAALTSWTTWVAAGIALVVLLAAGGALNSVLRGPRTYAAEPGCMYCTER